MLIHCLWFAEMYQIEKSNVLDRKKIAVLIIWTVLPRVSCRIRNYAVLRTTNMSPLSPSSYFLYRPGLQMLYGCTALYTVQCTQGASTSKKTQKKSFLPHCCTLYRIMEDSLYFYLQYLYLFSNQHRYHNIFSHRDSLHFIARSKVSGWISSGTRRSPPPPSIEIPEDGRQHSTPFSSSLGTDLRQGWQAGRHLQNHSQDRHYGQASTQAWPALLMSSYHTLGIKYQYFLFTYVTWRYI